MRLGGNTASNIITASQLAAGQAPGVEPGVMGELDGVMEFLNHPVVQPLVGALTKLISARAESYLTPKHPVAPQDRILYGTGAQY